MEENNKENWQKFAKLAQKYNSKYLTGQDRFQMVKDIYQLEGGEINGDFQTEYKGIADRLSTLVLRLDKTFPWEKFVGNFTNRESGVEMVDTVARDLLMIEQIQKMYKLLVNEEIDENFKSENTLEMEAFRLAYYLDFQDKYKNYIV